MPFQTVVIAVVIASQIPLKKVTILVQAVVIAVVIVVHNVLKNICTPVQRLVKNVTNSVHNLLPVSVWVKNHNNPATTAAIAVAIATKGFNDITTVSITQPTRTAVIAKFKALNRLTTTAIIFNAIRRPINTVNATFIKSIASLFSFSQPVNFLSHSVTFFNTALTIPKAVAIGLIDPSAPSKPKIVTAISPIMVATFFTAPHIFSKEIRKFSAMVIIFSAVFSSIPKLFIKSMPSCFDIFPNSTPINESTVAEIWSNVF